MEMLRPTSIGKISRFDDSRSFSYADIQKLSAGITSALKAKFGSGKRIALLMEPGPDFIVAFAGIVHSGCCAVVLSPLHTDSESAYYCNDSDAVALLCSESYRERAGRILQAQGDSHPTLLIGFEELKTASPQSIATLPSNLPDSAALQLYTSGTTGKPKGVVLTLGNLIHQQKLLREAWGLTENDILLHTLPLHHMHGLCIALLSSLGAGASVVFVPQFSAQLIWEKMESSTVFMAVPTIYAKLFQALDEAHAETQTRWKANARKLRLATSGSAALPVTLARRWKEITGTIPLERFGMSEIGVGLSNPLHGDRLEGCVGQALPTVKTRIVDGELWIAGPSVFREYYKRPEATAEAFVTVDGEHFFRTGDTVEVSEEGTFRILGRTSVDILKSGGYKLSALEIEEAIREHAGVSEVAVIGLPDPVWGDRVTACVVRRADHSELNPEALRSFLKERLAPYKVPKEVLFLNELPRNAMGKVIKPELKKRLERSS
jgi:malonyl-CoA/methylmalonyl-CoA synthetase